MNLKLKIVERMDKLQVMMESNQHLREPESVYDHTLTISKFWSVLSDDDRSYVQAAQFAIEEQLPWSE